MPEAVATPAAPNEIAPENNILLGFLNEGTEPPHKGNKEEVKPEADADAGPEDEKPEDAEATEGDDDEEGDEGRTGEDETPPEIPRSLILEAGRLGFSEEEIEEFGTEKALRAVLAREARRAEREDEARAAAAAKQDGDRKEPTEDIKLWDEDEEKKLLEAGFDKEIVAAIKKRFGTAEVAIKKLRENGLAEAKSMRDSLLQIEAERIDSAFDAACDSLDWAEKLGKSGSKGRQKVHEVFTRLGVADVQLNGRLGRSRIGELVSEAARLAFPDHAQETAQRAKADKADQRGRMQTPRNADTRTRMSPDEEGEAIMAEGIAQLREQEKRQKPGFFSRLRRGMTEKKGK